MTDPAWGFQFQMYELRFDQSPLLPSALVLDQWWHEIDHDQGYISWVHMTIIPIPEASPLVLLGSGLAACWRSRKRAA